MKISIYCAAYFRCMSPARSSIKVFSYDKEAFDEKDEPDVRSLERYVGSERVVWIDINGISGRRDMEILGSIFGLHPSAVRNSIKRERRPSFEEFSDHVLASVSSIYLENRRLKSEQISILVKGNLVITLRERSDDIFKELRDRIRKNTGKLRSKKGDYLAYCIMQELVDHYFDIIEYLGRRMDIVEEKVLKNPDNSIMEELHRIKREILFLKHMAWPMREVAEAMMRDETGNITKDTKRYLRPVEDKCMQIIELCETYRDMVSSMTDIYLSSLSYRTNEIMRVLTVIATIFIPLTFITGIYGMNFRYMPELYWRFAYPLVLLGMGMIALWMMLYFRKKGWV